MTTQTLAALKKQIIAACLEMNASGLNQGTSGNISARTRDGFVITASGVPYDQMKPRHIVEMDLEGTYRGNFLPSSEWRMHMDIYAARPEAQAVVHTHSPHATAISSLRRDVPAFHYMVAAAGGNSLRCADYATFGTQQLSDNMLTALEGRSACLLANHGTISFGPDLRKTFGLAVEVEALCKQYAVACQTGKPTILDDSEMANVLERFKTYGKQPAATTAGEVSNSPAVFAPVRRD
ncbi:MAG: class II aldolase/adducin family protein [Rhizobiaceae bacterium]